MDRIVEALAKLKTAKKVQRVALSEHRDPGEEGGPGRDRDRRPDARRPRRRDGRPAGLRGTLRVERPHRRRRHPAADQRRPPQRLLGRELPARLGRGRTSSRTASIYAVDGIAGREPRGFYHEATQTGVLVNTDLYGSLREPGPRAGHGHRRPDGRGRQCPGPCGACRPTSDGNGLILVGPPGTKKTELFFELLADPRFRLQANDIVFVRDRRREGRGRLRRAEALSADDRRSSSIPGWRRSSTGANARTSSSTRRTCADRDCQRDDDCRLDRGSAYCYKAAKEAPPFSIRPGSAVRAPR